MMIKELNIRETEYGALDISWDITDGIQTSYELFLIEGGTVSRMVRSSDRITKCRLLALLSPMAEYSLLLTVRSGEQLSSVRTGFFSQKDVELYQTVRYKY